MLLLDIITQTGRDVCQRGLRITLKLSAFLASSHPDPNASRTTRRPCQHVLPSLEVAVDRLEKVLHHRGVRQFVPEPDTKSPATQVHAQHHHATWGHARGRVKGEKVNESLKRSMDEKCANEQR